MNIDDVKISRGEVFYITSINNTIGSEQRSGRPAVVVSNNSNNEHSRCIEICYLTLQEKPPLPTHVKIDKGNCINSTVLCEQITSVSIDRLGDFMCRLPDDIMDKIDKCLVVSLDLSYIMSKGSSVDFSNSSKEMADFQNEIVCLKHELEKASKEVQYRQEQVDSFKLKADKADMYERMYNDLLDKLIKR